MDATANKVEGARRVLESLVRHRRESPTTKSAEMYYDLMRRYWGNILDAKARGEFVAGHSVLVPPEIFHAMGLVPYHLESVLTASMILLREQEPFLAAAKTFGLTPEVCSVHRAIAAAFTQGWAPAPDVVIWNNEVCDNTAKSNELVRERCRIPGFYFDCPYRSTPRSVQYVAAKLEELVGFLEELTGRSMDRERLAESLEISQRMVAVNEDINTLRKAIPAPGHNRLGSQLLYIGFYWMGTPQGLSFYETVRDELRETVEKGSAPPERYRLLSLFLPLSYSWRLLDWMEREHGARLVGETYCCHWGEMEWDLSAPFLTLARRLYAHPVCRSMHGPADGGVLTDAVEDARAYRVDGAIYWAHIGCRQSCATIKLAKDALREKAEIPTLTLEMDSNDPSFVSEEEMQAKLEEFFEILDERK
ncbi:MAG: 2-hydroxyacyl-CoA dehydratase subunit D [Candidatus Methylomirabilia bacterium]